MEEKKVSFSKTTVSMFQEMVDKMRSYHINLVNIYLLLYGIITSHNKEGKQNAFLDYLSNKSELSPNYVETIVKAYALSSKPNLLTRFGRLLNSLPIIENSKKTSEIVPEVKLYITDERGEDFEVPFDNETAIVFVKALELLAKYEIEELDPIHFVTAMFNANLLSFQEFLDDFGISYYDAKKHFELENIAKEKFIPQSLSSFLKLLNDEIDTSIPCQILMRDEETEKLWNIMLKANKRNAVIVGEPGVGKTALIEKITYEISSGDCPEKFKDYKVISLNVNNLISGTTYRGEAEKRIEDLVELLEDNPKIILFIDEVHNILGAGSANGSTLDLSNALKPILARGDTVVIGATTSEEYEWYFTRDSALSRRFERVDVEEPRPNQVYPMIKNKIDSLSKMHNNVVISEEMVNYCVMISGCFNNEKHDPDKTLDLIDRAMVLAEKKKKTSVDKESILGTCSIHFKTFENMSEDSKKEVAYHEAGHYIMLKASNKLIEYELQAVSIMPAENYNGVTVSNYNRNKIPYANLDYYIDLIAESLAGRVSESFFREDFTAGAASDLDSATKIAFNVVTKLGMGNDSFKNRIYLNTENYPMFSEKAINVINDEVNKLIEKAFNRATEVLESNRDILEALVKALLEKQIMSEAELDKVWQDVVSNRK